jgi:hypothetical protein
MAERVGFEPEAARAANRLNPARGACAKRMAERVGFEPTVGVNLHTLSKRAP